MQHIKIGLVVNIFCFWYFTIKSVTASLKWIKVKNDHGGLKATKRATVFQDDVAYIFGGEWKGEFNNNLYTLTDFEKGLTLLNTTGEYPSERAGATLTKIGTNLYLIGGYNSFGCLNSMYKYDTITNKWIHVHIANGFFFTPRSGHAVCTDGNNRLFLFGGYNDEGAFLNDLYEVHISHFYMNVSNSFAVHANFTLLSETSNNGPNPSPREYASMSIIDDKLYLFGGYSYGGSCADGMWVFDLNKKQWTQQVESTSPPPAQGNAIVQEAKCRPRPFNNGQSNILFWWVRRYLFYEALLQVGFIYILVMDPVKFGTMTLWKTNGQFCPQTLKNQKVVHLLDSSSSRVMLKFFSKPLDSIAMIGGSKMDLDLYNDIYHLDNLPSCSNEKFSCLGRGNSYNFLFNLQDNAMERNVNVTRVFKATIVPWQGRVLVINSN
ncbi:bifunctional Kelch repeat type 1/Kelch-type beta propeller [Babesia duncani]|uniref:Bifunctional Kelch repeat type 1/Kelch-type beta propeller n=1 Tax=Babesia duncani TaxID=323732 RepID=A0AAD9PMB2_9APIC|nr:bifunctional Kelch repeat type 1/Kelch-type beta propeller [Babesia duncani]